MEGNGIRDILMCVIGDALMEVDAGFMFGHDFGHIVDKWAPLVRHVTRLEEDDESWLRKDLARLREYIDGINESQTFPGGTYGLVCDQLAAIDDDIERLGWSQACAKKGDGQ